MRPSAIRLCLGLSVALAACSSNGRNPQGDDSGGPPPDAPHGGGSDGGSGSGSGAIDGGVGTIDGGGGVDGHGGLVFQVCANGGQYTTITAALQAASAGTEIDVCAGTYNEAIVIDKAIYLKGAGADSTTITAGGSGTAVTATGTADAGVIVDGFTITGGNSGGGGGGVLCEASTLTLRGSTILSNVATDGGGMYASACTLDVHDNTFKSNHLSGAGTGGGANFQASHGSVHGNLFDSNHAEHGGGLAVVDGDVSIEGNEFNANTAGTQGGGMWISSDSDVGGNKVHDGVGGWTAGGVYVYQHAPLIHDNDVYNNTCQNDGAGAYFHMSQATVRANHFHDNQAGDDAGGFRVFESSLTVDSNEVDHNTCVDGGGGIKVSHVPSNFMNNQIHDNQGGTGGGVMDDNDASTWTGDHVYNNTASSGGAFWIDLSPWTGAHLDNVLVEGNHAYSGGGITIWNNIEPVYLNGVIIRNNSSSTLGGGIHASGSTYVITHSLIEGNTSQGGGGIFHGTPDAWTDPCPCPQTTTDGTVEFSVIDGNSATNGGSAIRADIQGLLVEDSILYNHAGTAVYTTAPISWQYNDLMPESFSGMSDPTGSNGNIATDPSFVDATSGDFHLSVGSACINAGDPTMTDADGSRADMGMFGGAQ